MVVIPVELYSSKNSRQVLKAGNGRTYVAKSNIAKKQEKELTEILYYLMPSWTQEIRKMKKFPVKIKFKIYRKTHRRFDYVNIVQNLLDCMVKAKWLPDDSADYVIPVFDNYEVDTKYPRVEIEVLND